VIEVKLPTAHEWLADRFVALALEAALNAGFDRDALALAMISKAAALIAVHESRPHAAALLRGAADHVERPPN
jgi:hypothetical protein